MSLSWTGSGETLQCSECSGWLLPKGVDQPSVVVSVTKRLVIREVVPRGGLASSLSAAEFAGDQIAEIGIPSDLVGITVDSSTEYLFWADLI